MPSSTSEGACIGFTKNGGKRNDPFVSNLAGFKRAATARSAMAAESNLAIVPLSTIDHQSYYDIIAPHPVYVQIGLGPERTSENLNPVSWQKDLRR